MRYRHSADASSYARRATQCTMLRHECSCIVFPRSLRPPRCTITSASSDANGGKVTWAYPSALTQCDSTLHCFGANAITPSGAVQDTTCSGTCSATYNMHFNVQCNMHCIIQHASYNMQCNMQHAVQHTTRSVHSAKPKEAETRSRLASLLTVAVSPIGHSRLRWSDIHSIRPFIRRFVGLLLQPARAGVASDCAAEACAA